jgi:hypothetical protein
MFGFLNASKFQVCGIMTVPSFVTLIDALSGPKRVGVRAWGSCSTSCVLHSRCKTVPLFAARPNVYVRDDVAKAHFLCGSKARRAVASRSRMAGRHDRTDR